MLGWAGPVDPLVVEVYCSVLGWAGPVDPLVVEVYCSHLQVWW